MRCAVCHTEIPAGAGACPGCGTNVDALPVHPEARTYRMRAVGIAVVVLVWLAVLAEAVVALFPLVGRAMAARARDTDDVDLLNLATTFNALAVVPYLVAFVAAAVVVIIWMFRARKNLDAIPGAHRGMGAGWAIGGWFIPFANLVIPYRVMANVARESLGHSRTPALVGVWWAAWLVSVIGDRIVSRIDTNAFEALPTELAGPDDYQRYVDYYEDAIVPNVVLLLATVVAAAALSALVVRITRAQDARIARGGPSGPLFPGASVPVQPEPLSQPDQPSQPVQPGQSGQPGPAAPGRPAGAGET
jgi:Domain of unknown function (DUF4328)